MKTSRELLFDDVLDIETGEIIYSGTGAFEFVYANDDKYMIARVDEGEEYKWIHFNKSLGKELETVSRTYTIWVYSIA